MTTTSSKNKNKNKNKIKIKIPQITCYMTRITQEEPIFPRQKIKGIVFRAPMIRYGISCSVQQLVRSAQQEKKYKKKNKKESLLRARPLSLLPPVTAADNNIKTWKVKGNIFTLLIGGFSLFHGGRYLERA
jgi:hypothetical protein